MKTRSTAQSSTTKHVGQSQIAPNLVCTGSATRAMGSTHAVSPVFSSANSPQTNRSRLLGKCD